MTPALRLLDFIEHCKRKKLFGIENDTAFLRHCGISDESFVSQLRAGRATNFRILTLQKICRATGASADWITVGKGPMFFNGQDTQKAKEHLEKALNLL